MLVMFFQLGGFELAKTETSLKKSPRDMEIRSLCYTPPEMLDNVNHVYSKECEMYRWATTVLRAARFSGFIIGLFTYL